MSEVFPLCEKGLGNVNKVKESVALKDLRFMSHLCREMSLRVFCGVNVLRDGEEGENHPSLCVLAMKATLNLASYGEAEKDLHQKSLLEKGSDTRPPMLDMTNFESWQQRIRLYCKGKDNGEYIVQSIDEGLFKMGKYRDEIALGPDGPYLGPERDRVYTYLSQPEKDRLKADVRATNILLQGLPKDIYKLINHNIDAKDIWDNVKMLLEGSELTKDDRESPLHIKITMPKIQLNSKFVNYMLPEWGRFVTAVKLNKGLKESNHDQLYAYLKQHEVHANENKMLMERLNLHSNDPLALVSNVLPYQYSPSSSVPPQPSYIPPVTYQPQFADNTPLNTGNGGAQNRAGNANAEQGKPIKCYNYNGIGHIGDQCDAFDSDVDEAPTTQTMFMANLSSADPDYDEAGPLYDSDALFEDAQYVTSNQPTMTVNASLTAELARYKELAKVYEKRA
ncbi:hypothetical protein Tco_1210003 [Tanacetum coccineum]